jgi:hypothetical protein
MKQFCRSLWYMLILVHFKNEGVVCCIYSNSIKVLGFEEAGWQYLQIYQVPFFFEIEYLFANGLIQPLILHVSKVIFLSMVFE